MTDIDECRDNGHDCHVNATCTDTDGGFICRCMESYEGIGTVCESQYKNGACLIILAGEKEFASITSTLLDTVTILSYYI